MLVGIIQSIEGGCEQNKRQRKGEFTPFSCLTVELGHLISSFPSTQIEVHTTDSPGSQVFRLRLNYTTDFPGSPACRWQTVGLLSLHNYTSHFLIISLSLSLSLSFIYTVPIYLFVYLSIPIGSVSLENPIME